MQGWEAEREDECCLYLGLDRSGLGVLWLAHSTQKFLIKTKVTKAADWLGGVKARHLITHTKKKNTNVHWINYMTTDEHTNVPARIHPSTNLSTPSTRTHSTCPDMHTPPTHTHTHTCTHICAHECTCTYMYTCTHIQDPHTCFQTHTHTMYTHTSTCPPPPTHTHTITHTHTMRPHKNYLHVVHTIHPPHTQTQCTYTATCLHVYIITHHTHNHQHTHTHNAHVYTSTHMHTHTHTHTHRKPALLPWFPVCVAAHPPGHWSEPWSPHALGRSYAQMVRSQCPSGQWGAKGQ